MKLFNLFFVVLTFLCFGCSIRGQNFSYSTKTYSIEKGIKTDIKNHGNYVSFPPYLFEFNIRVNQYDSIQSRTGQRMSSVTFDTASVYIIDPTKKLFFEFDSFRINAKLISNGQLKDKKFGIAFKENSTTGVDTAFKKDLLRDTVVSGKRLVYCSSVEKSVDNTDSVLTHIFFLKKPNFISFHDVPNRLVKDRTYSMVGFSVRLVKQHLSVSSELEELRTLNRFEEKICTGMINAMAASNK